MSYYYNPHNPGDFPDGESLHNYSYCLHRLYKYIIPYTSSENIIIYAHRVHSLGLTLLKLGLDV